MTQPRKSGKCKAPGCGKEFERFTSMQKTCPTYQCTQAHEKDKARTRIKSGARKQRKAHRDNDLKHQTELTQKAFNWMIRALDAFRGCVSCGKPSGSYTLTAGHFRTVGSHPELRFDPRNCHGQCSGCNKGQQRKYKGDNATTRQKFEAELFHRYGQALLDYINGPHQAKQYTCDELKTMRAEFAAEARRLEGGGDPSRDWRAVPAEGAA